MVERKDEGERVKVEGQIERDILSAETESEINNKKRKIESMKAEGEYKINLLNEKGNIKIKKIESDNERKKDENNHKKEMTIIGKNQIKEMNKIQDEHEINLLKQNNESKKKNAEIDRNIKNNQEKEKREMAKIKGNYDLKITQLNADHDVAMKKFKNKKIAK